MSKPRIRKLGPVFWACASADRGCAVGRTPLDAYMAWRRDAQRLFA